MKLHRKMGAMVGLMIALLASSALAQTRITVLLPANYPDEIVKEFTERTGIEVESQTLAWDRH